MEGYKLICEHGMEDNADLLMEAHPNPTFHSHFSSQGRSCGTGLA